MRHFKIFYSILTTVFMVFITANPAICRTVSHLANEETDSQGRPLYRQGLLTIKVKESVAQIVPQKNAVSFGLASLDEKINRFEVNRLDKRFRYNPAKLERDLPDLSRIYVIGFPDECDLQTVARAFAGDPNVEYAEPVPISYLNETPNDELYAFMPHLPQILAEQAWDIHHGQNGQSEVIIGIVDTGVDWDHPDLVDNIRQNLGEDSDGDGQTLEFIDSTWVFDPGDENDIDDDGNGYADDFIGWDFFAEDEGFGNDPADENSHGTHVAGIAAGVTNNEIGIASISWNVKILATSHGSSTTGTSIIRGYDGIIYAAENGAHLINCSWGSSTYSYANAEVIAYAVGLGSIIVGSAGNGNSDQISYPNGFPGVVNVASVSVTDNKASYSDYGISVDVSAPGGTYGSNGIYSTIPDGYGRKTGTSMSSPLVAGLLGLLKSYHPDWDNNQLLIQMLGTADNIDDLNPAYAGMLGSGRINAYRSLTDEPDILPLRLEFAGVLAPTDDDGDGALEPGENFALNFELHNHAHISCDNVSFSLATDDPDLEILDNTFSGSLVADGKTTLENAFQIRVSQEAAFHFATLAITAQADLPITFGSEFEFDLPLAASGVFVWEGIENEQDYSGTFIRDFLLDQDFTVNYSTVFPHSFTGFEAVFLSFGSGETSLARFDTQLRVNAVQTYLHNGGRLYLEGRDALGWDQRGNLPLFSLFGLADATDGPATKPELENLVGQESTLAENIIFNGSSQSNFVYVDQFRPDENGLAAFVEPGYDTVAVQFEGQFDQKTFCFSYALAELVDGDAPNTRWHLMNRIKEFFEITSVNIEDNPGNPANLPTAFSLSQNFPNPIFLSQAKNNSLTTIRYALPTTGRISLNIYNTAGQFVRSLVDRDQVPGHHQIMWDGNNRKGEPVASGLYLIEADFKSAPSGESCVAKKRMILLR